MPSAWEEERLLREAAARRANEARANPMGLDPYSPIPQTSEISSARARQSSGEISITKHHLEDIVHRLDMLAQREDVYMSSVSNQLDIEDIAAELRALLPG